MEPTEIAILVTIVFGMTVLLGWAWYISYQQGFKLGKLLTACAALVYVALHAPMWYELLNLRQHRGTWLWALAVPLGLLSVCAALCLGRRMAARLVDVYLPRLFRQFKRG